MPDNLPNEKVIYRDDVVQCSKKEDMLGLVMEVPGDSDSEDSISDESDAENDVESQGGGDDNNNTENGGEDGEENEHLADGQCRVKWLDGSESTISLNDVSVVDRGFLHGDFVASVADPTGQLGLVMDVSITVHVMSLTGDIITNVHSGDLMRVRKFAVGDYVLHGSWLGRVEDATDNVTVLFDDGSVCKVTNADPLSLKPVSKSLIDDTDFPYYPGQRVRASSSSIFKGSRWLSGLWKPNRLEGTVSRIQTGSVYVYWIASSSTGSCDNPTEAPTEEQNPKDLTHLSYFAYANWELGQWCLYSGNNTTENLIEDNEMHGYRYGSLCDSCTRNLDHEVGNQEVICALKPSEMREDHPCPNDALLALNSSSVSDSRDLEENYDRNADCANGLDEVFKSDQCDSSEDLSAGYNIDDNRKGEMCNPAPRIESCGGMSSDCKEPTRESWSAYRKKFRKVVVKREKKGRKKSESMERACLIINTRRKVDVVWQDGTRDFHLDSKSLIPINSPGDQEFFPEQYVIEKSLNDGDDSSEVKRVGVVRSLNSKERTACVRWLKVVSRPEEPREFEKEEVVSAYELDAHPDYDYCYGDIVVRLSPVSISSSPIAMCPAERPEDHANSCKDENETDVRSTACYTDQAPHNELDAESHLPWVGHITGLKDGDIEVKWADGMISTVGPQAIYVVGREDDGEPFDGGSEYSDGASWETVEENEVSSLDNVIEESGLPPASENTTKAEVNSPCPSDGVDPVRKGPFSTAISYVKNLATGFLSHGKKQMDLLDSDIKNPKETGLHQTVEAVSNNQSSSKESEGICDHYKLNDSASEDECRSEKDTACPEPHNNFSEHLPKETGVKSNMVDGEIVSCGFRHFDITTKPLDHYYLGDGQAGGSKQWVKKVQQEWNILEKNLPDAIYVRVFEDRMDILRAVIIGACGTPYQDGLFFFDFQLPQEYPQVPPLAYYHSGGLRINPNLYEDGKVCLSLLNTWTGKGNEIWDPSSSSILQVLVSLQGLVLNSKPYFNEAGYDKQIGTAEGEKNYLPYNENTFLLNLKSMTYLLRRPPMHFEDFVKDHFRRRGNYILKACDAYMKGCLVGSLTRDACASDEISNHSCSVGFKLMLAKIAPRLRAALSEVGADCSGFEHFLNA